MIVKEGLMTGRRASSEMKNQIGFLRCNKAFYSGEVSDVDRMQRIRAGALDHSMSTPAQHFVQVGPSLATSSENNGFCHGDPGYSIGGSPFLAQRELINYRNLRQRENHSGAV